MISRRTFFASFPAAWAARGIAQTEKPFIPVERLNHMTLQLGEICL
jgi:hypothetical protein